MSKEYNRYLQDHINTVAMARNWIMQHVGEKRVLDILPGCADGYSDQPSIDFNIGFEHDSSKYSMFEYEAYDNYFYGDCGIKNPNGASKEVEKAFDYAWLHHIHVNPHHWQHWVLINDDEGTEALEMPDISILEMVCDWWSFSWREGDLYELFTWWTEHCDHIMLHERTKVKVLALLDAINEALIAEEDEKK